VAPSGVRVIISNDARQFCY